MKVCLDIFGYADMLTLLGGGFKYFIYCIFFYVHPYLGKIPIVSNSNIVNWVETIT